MISEHRIRIARRGAHRSGTEQIGILAHITLVLLPILAIVSVVNLANLRGGIEGDLNEAILKVQLQWLIARCDRVLAQRERWLLLEVFPAGDLSGQTVLPDVFAVAEDGFPKDPRFKRLCTRAQQEVGNKTVDQLVAELYDAAIHLDVDDETLGADENRMRTPAPKGEPQAPEITEGHRAYAMRRIRERVLTWEPRVVSVQQAALVAAFKAETNKVLRGAIAAPDVEAIEENMSRECDARGIPLLPSVLSEKE